MKFFTVVLPALVIALVVVILFPVAGRAASGNDFDSVVSAVEHRYSAHAQRIPMMGLVSFCAHIATKGGVKGMKVAEFDNLPAARESGDLEELVRQSLGPNWQPFVVDHARNGDDSVIYVQPDGGSMRMMIADFDHGELDLVRVEVNGDRLSHWVHDPEGSAKKHDYGKSEGETD